MTIFTRLILLFIITCSSSFAFAYCPTGEIYNGCDGDFNEYFLTTGIKYGRCTNDGPPSNYMAGTQYCSASIKNSSLHFPISEYDYHDSIPAPHPTIAGRFVLPTQHNGNQVLILIRSDNIAPNHVALIPPIPYPTGCTTSSNIVSCTSTKPEPEGCHTNNTCPYPNDELDLSTGFIFDNGGKCTIQGFACFPVPAAWSNGCVPVYRNSYCDTVNVNSSNFVRPTDFTDPNSNNPPDPDPETPDPVDSFLGVGNGCHLNDTCSYFGSHWQNAGIDSSTGYGTDTGAACAAEVGTVGQCYKFPTRNAYGCIPHLKNLACSSTRPIVTSAGVFSSLNPWVPSVAIDYPPINAGPALEYDNSNFIWTHNNGDHSSWGIDTMHPDQHGCHRDGNCSGDSRNRKLDTSTGWATETGWACPFKFPNCTKINPPNASGCISHPTNRGCNYPSNSEYIAPSDQYYLKAPYVPVTPDPDPVTDPVLDPSTGLDGYVDYSNRLGKGSYGTEAADLLVVEKAKFIAERSRITSQFSNRLNVTFQGSTVSNDNIINIRGEEGNIGVSKWFPILNQWNFPALIFFSYAFTAFLILFRRD